MGWCYECFFGWCWDTVALDESLGDNYRFIKLHFRLAEKRIC